MAYSYDEQDDPEEAAEPLGDIPDYTPEERAWMDAQATEGRTLSTAAMVAEWEANPPATRCAWCCREMPPEPGGEPYPTCPECLASDERSC